MCTTTKRSARLKAASLIATASAAAGTAAITSPTASAVTWTPGPAEYIQTYSTSAAAQPGDTTFEYPSFIALDIDQDGQSDFQLAYYDSASTVFIFYDATGYTNTPTGNKNSTSRFLGEYIPDEDGVRYQHLVQAFSDTNAIYEAAIKTEDIPYKKNSISFPQTLKDNNTHLIGGTFENAEQSYVVYFEMQFDNSKRITFHSIGYTTIPEPSAMWAIGFLAPILRRKRRF